MVHLHIMILMELLWSSLNMVVLLYLKWSEEFAATGKAKLVDALAPSGKRGCVNNAL